MGQIMLNGNAYAGADGGACGCFVDTGNVIKANSAIIDFPYVATQDCAVYVSVSATNVGVFFSVDGEILYSHNSSASFTYTNTIFLRRGQSLDMMQTAGTLSSSSYTVYGVIQGLDSTTQDRYSTSEKAVGVWVDGSIVYEKSYAGTISSTQQTIEDFGQTTITMVSGVGMVAKTTGSQMAFGMLPSATNWQSGLHITSNTLKLFTTNEVNGGTYRITIRYTKAST